MSVTYHYRYCRCKRDFVEFLKSYKGYPDVVLRRLPLGALQRLKREAIEEHEEVYLRRDEVLEAVTEKL